ncbi:hypothetical protein CTAYLR_007495 [Chrysophaeum taylorii]|uniref:ribonuclease Z n=1 Tax=Chrysophaeum taylorii TaxID=2483200 RepID=A0AAD7XPZ3_9STRA|nr:hypothetical protein CTAYLR_007495 [Chrysophaeum taylorii]
MGKSKKARSARVNDGAMTSRYTSLQLLSTSSGDSSPSVLVSSDAERILFNAGEGWQRMCVEQGVRISRCDTMCLTHLSPDAVGGLPGYLLTTADAGQTRVALCGPPGLRKYVAAMRHYFRRDELTIDVEELGSADVPVAETKCFGYRGKDGVLDVSAVAVRVVEEDEASSHKSSPAPPVAKRPRVEEEEEKPVARYCASYVCRTPSVVGRFDVKKAKELGIPAGPLYGKLKSGASVKLSDGRVIEPSMVVGANQPGGSCAVVQCLSVETIDRLASTSTIARLFDAEPVDCVVHATPPRVARTDAYAAFVARFPASTTHVTTHARDESPFRTALLDARLLHRLAPELYVNPVLGASENNLTPQSSRPKNVVDGRPMLRYTLVPRDATGLDAAAVTDAPPDFEVDDSSLERARAVFARATTTEVVDPRDAELVERGRPRTACGRDARLVFLGTGSAIPSKHRNVSAIYLQCTRGDEEGSAGPGMLLDVGEGTVGQIYKAFGSATPSVLAQLHAVWISHPHADHHLGLPRLLLERRKYATEPLVLMAPWPVLRWLHEYEAVDDGARGTYIQVESSWIRRRDVPHPEAARLGKNLGLSACWNVRVRHCPHAYGLVVRSAAGWSLCYSGDCRPSPELVREANRVSVLVHEATFEDEFHDDAVAKNHSTVSEAICVGRDMQAHRTILTHFSQLMVPLQGSSCAPVLLHFVLKPLQVASDFMQLTFPQLLWAPALVPVVRAALAERAVSRVVDGECETTTSVTVFFVILHLMLVSYTGLQQAPLLLSE